MKKYLIGLVVVIIIAGAGYFVWWTLPRAAPIEPSPTVPQLQTYASSTLGISLQYPAGYTRNDAYAYIVFPQKPISGVSFTIPLSVATGTNLSPDTYVSVEWLPRARACTGDIYLRADVRTATLTEASTTYSVASSTGAAAGNFYEEWVYAIVGSKPCTAVRYFIHSTNIGNYPAGSVRMFSYSALIAEFDSIRRSLQFATSTRP